MEASSSDKGSIKLVTNDRTLGYPHRQHWATDLVVDPNLNRPIETHLSENQFQSFASSARNLPYNDSRRLYASDPWQLQLRCLPRSSMPRRFGPPWLRARAWWPAWPTG